MNGQNITDPTLVTYLEKVDDVGSRLIGEVEKQELVFHRKKLEKEIGSLISACVDIFARCKEMGLKEAATEVVRTRVYNKLITIRLQAYRKLANIADGEVRLQILPILRDRLDVFIKKLFPGPLPRLTSKFACARCGRHRVIFD